MRATSHERSTRCWEAADTSGGCWSPRPWRRAQARRDSAADGWRRCRQATRALPFGKRLPCKPLVGLSEVFVVGTEELLRPLCAASGVGARVGEDGEGERFAQHAASERCAREARAKRAVGVASGGTCAAGPALSNQASTRAALQRCAAPCA